MSASPYADLDISQWQHRTRELIESYPLHVNTLYELVLETWDALFVSRIGRKPYRIGKDIFPQPQIMGFFLHELIPLELETRYRGIWRRNTGVDEKDVVHIPDDRFSIEIKTSSSTRNIYGNRSYVQPGTSTRKTKSGYYLAINFQKFTPQISKPSITIVRFGWLDHEDWLGQKAATGQQARLSSSAEQHKLLRLPIVE